MCAPPARTLAFLRCLLLSLLQPHVLLDRALVLARLAAQGLLARVSSKARQRARRQATHLVGLGGDGVELGLVGTLLGELAPKLFKACLLLLFGERYILESEMSVKSSWAARHTPAHLLG